MGGVGQTSLTWSADGGDAGYLALREDIAEASPDLHGGLYLEGVHARGLLLRGGLGYQNYRSRSRYFGPIVTETRTRTLTDPETGEVLGETTEVVSSQVYSEVNNSHQTLHVTLGAGYRLSVGSRVHPYAIAEAGYEFLIGSEGSTLSPALEEVRLDNSTGEWVASPGLRLGAGLGVDVDVAGPLSVGLSGHFARLGGLDGADDPLVQRQTAVYGLAGLVWRF